MWPSPDQHWFRRRRFGIGWTPVATQGWISLVVFTAVLIVDIAWFIGGGPHPSNLHLIGVGLVFSLDVLGILWVCVRTGEAPQ